MKFPSIKETNCNKSGKRNAHENKCEKGRMQFSEQLSFRPTHWNLAIPIPPVSTAFPILLFPSDDDYLDEDTYSVPMEKQV